MTRMDIDTLIASILQRPAIWDKRDKSHSNRSYVDRCWKEIARNMNTEESALRKKWKYLREQFCVELGKLAHPYNGPGDEGVAVGQTETKWPYFKALMFLREVVKPRITIAPTNNLVVPVDPMTFTDHDESEEDDTPLDQLKMHASLNFDSGKLSPPAESNASSTSRKRPCPDDDVMAELERKRLQLLKNEELEDEDLMFFRSLLPHVRLVPPDQKLLLRSKVLEVVSRFVYPQTSLVTPREWCKDFNRY